MKKTKFWRQGIFPGFDVVLSKARNRIYDVLIRYNPTWVMLSISAFGDTEPYKDRPGYDLLTQVISVLMSWAGEESVLLLKAKFPVANLTTGVFDLSGVLSAVFHRIQIGGGTGQRQSYATDA